MNGIGFDSRLTSMPPPSNLLTPSSKGSELSILLTSVLFCRQSITLKEALKSALTILKQVMEEKLNASNVELATITPENNFQMHSKEQLEALIASI